MLTNRFLKEKDKQKNKKSGAQNKKIRKQKEAEIKQVTSDIRKLFPKGESSFELFHSTCFKIVFLHQNLDVNTPTTSTSVSIDSTHDQSHDETYDEKPTESLYESQNESEVIDVVEETSGCSSYFDFVLISFI